MTLRFRQTPLQSIALRWHKLDIRSKFNVFLIAFLIPLAVILALLSYHHEKKLLLEESRTKAEMVLREASAIRHYVEEVLRPKMYTILEKDDFVIEAMSTTFVSTSVQKRFGAYMPGYDYRRVASRPRNPTNAPDDLEKEMIRWFDEDREMKVWSGEVTRNRERVFFVAEAVVVKRECLRCHGRPEAAPKILRERYGDQGGFGYSTGQIMGVNSVSVPMSSAMGKVRGASVTIAIAAVLGFLVLIAVINQIFGRLVAHRLGFLTSLSERLVASRDPEGAPPHEPPRDEIETLEDRMDYLARHVRTLRSSYGLGPKFVGKYVVEHPQFPGFVSWIYSARHADTEARASLKIPFPSLVDNPYYYHAFVNELQILEGLDHPNVIRVDHREKDFLVMELVQGKPLKELLGRKRKFTPEEAEKLFAQLCDVMAYLHNKGIVHHNLTPSNVVVTADGTVKLIDFGLAWSRSLVDPIKEAGAGLQGTFETIAPEQVRGVRGDARSDIYAMGGILYMILTGEQPFASGPSGDRLGLKMLVSPTPPRIHEPSLAPELEAVILRSLESDPDDRYQWVEDFCNELRRAFGTGREQPPESGNTV